MIELKLNQMTHGKLQSNQSYHGRTQIKSNDMWQSLIQLKTPW
jgi:hypothetical protein